MITPPAKAQSTMPHDGPTQPLTPGPHRIPQVMPGLGAIDQTLGTSRRPNLARQRNIVACMRVRRPVPPHQASSHFGRRRNEPGRHRTAARRRGANRRAVASGSMPWRVPSRLWSAMTMRPRQRRARPAPPSSSWTRSGRNTRGGFRGPSAWLPCRNGAHSTHVSRRRKTGAGRTATSPLPKRWRCDSGRLRRRPEYRRRVAGTPNRPHRRPH